MVRAPSAGVDPFLITLWIGVNVNNRQLLLTSNVHEA